MPQLSCMQCDLSCTWAERYLYSQCLAVFLFAGAHTNFIVLSLDSCAGEGLLAEEEAAPGRLAFLLFIQLEAEAADEALLSQATKNLVFLAPRLLAADAAAGRVPILASAKTGDAAISGHGGNAAKLGNGSGEVSGDDVDAGVDDGMAGDGDGDVAAGGGLSALTLHGLIRWDLLISSPGPHDAQPGPSA